MNKNKTIIEIEKFFDKNFPKHEGGHLDGRYWYIDIHDDEIAPWVEEMKQELTNLIQRKQDEYLEEVLEAYEKWCWSEDKGGLEKIDAKDWIKTFIRQFKEQGDR